MTSTLVEMPCPTCNKEGREACVSCDLCQSHVYCSDECKQIGWSVHQCNVIRVADPNMTVFVPLEAEEEGQGEEQNYLLQYVSPKGEIEQRLIEGKAAFGPGGSKMGRGPAQMPKNVQNARYTMGIDLIENAFVPNSTVSLVLEGMTFGDDSIWRGADGLAGRLARGNLVRGFQGDDSSYILWPSPARIQRATAQREGGFPIPINGGALRLWVRVNGRIVGDIYGVYCFDKSAGQSLGFAKRLVRRLNPFQSEFKNKFQRESEVTASLQNLEFLRGTDAEGNTVQLTFEVTRSKDGIMAKDARLLDIEYRVNMRRVQDAVLSPLAQSASGERTQSPVASEARSASDAKKTPQRTSLASEARSASDASSDASDFPKFVNEKLSFSCDPSNLDHITGLVMALEDKLASGELDGPIIRQQFDVINAHRMALEENPHLEPSPKIHAAVQGATQALWEHIESKTKERYYQDKLMRGGPTTAKALAQELADKMGKARARTGLGKRLLSPWQKSKARRDMKDLQSAILMARGQAGLSDATVRQYDEALRILSQAMDPNYQGGGGGDE